MVNPPPAVVLPGPPGINPAWERDRERERNTKESTNASVKGGATIIGDHTIPIDIEDKSLSQSTRPGKGLSLPGPVDCETLFPPIGHLSRPCYDDSMETTSPPIAAPPRAGGRLYLWLGLALGLLGPTLYAVQLQAHRLTVPWYMPILGTIGAATMLFAATRNRGIWRFLLSALLVVLATGEWSLLLSKSKLPPYTGPVAVGKPFPAFSTTLADGSKFDETNLKGEQTTALVFFRGRW